MIVRRLVLGVLSAFLATLSISWQPGAALATDESGNRVSGSLEAAFRQPPDTVKPWAYWWWLKGNVTRESITRDLEAMKRVGIGGLLHFDARAYHEDHVAPPESRMEFMSSQWREMLKFSIAEAGRLGLEVSVNLSSGAGALKGPWEVGDDAPKKLVWTATEVRGPKFSLELKKLKGHRFWDVAVLAVKHDDAAATVSDQWKDIAAELGSQPAVTEVVDLTEKIDAQGQLVWEAPKGRWTLLRFACMTMEGHEYDVDILDAKAVEAHFNRMGKPILEDAGPLAGKTLTHFYSVSWEGAVPTWTFTLGKEFDKYRGYSLRPWLPVLAGFTLRTTDESERFLRDYYRTLGDCFRDNFYGTMRELCHSAGLKWHSESGGPWDRKLASFAEADQLAFLGQNDMPQGEFWFTGVPPSKNSLDLNRPQAMAAHIYGKPLAASEAFTHMVQHWSAYPAALKPLADAAFCDGVNHFIWHTFTASPAELGQPGSEYFAGTHINPNVTWFPQAGPFMDYLARCQFMLRQGLFVGDVCVYIGDKPYQHWGRGTSWSPKATLTLAPGYAYDLVNTEVLLSRLAVKEGDLALPDGMRYRALVVDLEDDTVPPAALKKIVGLTQAGATVVLGRRQPQSARGLTDYPTCDQEIRRLASELWGDGSSQPCRRTLGRGKVILGTALNQVLQAERIYSDFEGPAEYLHRRTADTDIYFVSGQVAADCTFRVAGKEPELWDPTTGHIRDAVAWRASNDGRTIVPLSLPENGAVFVVFRRPAEKQHLASAPTDGAEIVGRDTAGAQVRTWGQEALTLSGPWALRFEPGRGAPESAVFEELLAWDEHPDQGIKYFSGRATYRKSFALTEGQAKSLVRLRLGQVKYIAQVKLNGHDLGVVWTAPWTVELTGAVKPGTNELEIAVVNTWVNRLIGDAALPPEKRIAKTNVFLAPGKRSFPAFKGFSSEDPLMPSGLLGPVRVEFGARRATPL